MVACLACRLMLPPADSVPCTKCVSLGVWTNAPLVESTAAAPLSEPISSTGSAAVVAPEGTEPVSAMLMAPPGA